MEALNNTMLLPSEWLGLLADEDSPAFGYLSKLYGTDRTVLREKAEVCRRAVGGFRHEHGDDSAVFIVRSTGRVNLMGMHIDHRGGFVNAISVDEMFMVVQARDDDVVVSKNVDRERFPDASFKIADEMPSEKISDWDAWTQKEHEKRMAAGRAGHWGDYIKSAVLYMQHLNTDSGGRFAPLLKGMNLMVDSRIPIASGLSSSSALVVAAAEACVAVNGLNVGDMELIDICGVGEWYVGTRGGQGDHAAIKFGRLDHVVHMGSFPLTVEPVPFPGGYRIVLANSLKEAKKSEGARDIFNQRVASYEFGLMMLRKNFPESADKMEHLRDVNPRTLGVEESEIYSMVGGLPERVGRDSIREALPEQSARIEQIFLTHAEPEAGYAIRQVTLYGITECIRSAMAADFLKNGDIAGFGELINISHDGDRVTRLVDGERFPVENRIPDDRIEALIDALGSGDPERARAAQLWRQPGGYNVSCAEVDILVDIARDTPGVLGAGLVGAGLGGCMVALVEEERAKNLIEDMAEQYYAPRKLPTAAEVVRPVGGAGVMRLSG